MKTPHRLSPSLEGPSRDTCWVSCLLKSERAFLFLQLLLLYLYLHLHLPMSQHCRRLPRGPDAMDLPVRFPAKSNSWGSSNRSVARSGARGLGVLEDGVGGGTVWPFCPNTPQT